MTENLSSPYVAIIDIGSNAVRLVIYDGLNRAPVRIHNERNVCGLGADLSRTGKLHPGAVVEALETLRRFSALLSAMKVTTVHAAATAALRDAKDGGEFIQKVRSDFGIDIRVIEGDEEARLAAAGVLMNSSIRHGMIGDYGGGSLELIAVQNQKMTAAGSLPVGSHRLLAEPSKAARQKKVEEHLASLSFLQGHKGGDFYALGGAWRAMAKAHMHLSHHAFKILDHYTIDGQKAREFAALVVKQGAALFEKTAGVSKKRGKDMEVSALVMQILFDMIAPDRLIFSSTGLREGLLFDRLSEPVQKQDPLFASAAKMSLKISRFDDLKAFRMLYEWIKPLFAGVEEETLRMIEASCLLSDMAWFEHEDYQADQAFQRLLVLPFYGVDHPGRAFLALTQYVHYRGHLRRAVRNKKEPDITQAAQQALPKEAIDTAVTVGLAQRLAYGLTGGALSLLRHMSLELSSENVTLRLYEEAQLLSTDMTGHALDYLAKHLGRKAVILK